MHLRERVCRVSTSPPPHPPISQKHIIPLHHHPQWHPTYTIPLTPTQPHTIPTHTIPQHHPPYTNPHTPPPSYPCPHTIHHHTIGPEQGPGAAAPCGTCSASTGFSGYPAPIRSLGVSLSTRGCREEGRQRALDSVCAGEWCRGHTVPASTLCPSWRVGHPAQDTRP